MTTDANKAMLKVILRKRIIVADDFVFDAEREVDLPIPPFVGLQLYNTEWQMPGVDESEDHIEAIGYDLTMGRVLCYLPVTDFRPERSGSDDWTEEEVRQIYRRMHISRKERFGGLLECPIA